MAIRTNKQAVYAVDQKTAGTFQGGIDKSNLIPISADVSKTFIEDNSVEKPELRGTFGANDSVIISQTQGISIPTFIQGGDLTADGAKSIKKPPVHPLLKACFHTEKSLANDLTAESDASAAVVWQYAPADADVVGASIIYQLDTITQQMSDAKGTMSLSLATGEFSTMTFEMQGPYSAPTKPTLPTGTANTYPEVLAVSGQNTLSVPALPEEFADCVRSFSLTQGVTISSIDCATKAGNNKIKYVISGRSVTGELVVDVSDGSDLAKLVAAWGGQKMLSAPFSVASAAPKGLIVLGTKPGNQIAIGADNFKIGAPTLNDAEGIATWTLPLTFFARGGKPEYTLNYIGNLA